MFKTIPISEITVHREDRQRRELEGIDELAASIAGPSGLIQPITVDENLILIAGERRFEACKKLGWTHIPARYYEDLSEGQRVLIELEENIKRQAISWQEEARAIEKYHRVCRDEQGDSWTQKQTAGMLNKSPQVVSDYLIVAREMADESVSKADTLKTAVIRANMIARKRADDFMCMIRPPDSTHSPVLHADFLEWAPAATEKFNFIHCDFPYGIDAHKSAGQNSALPVRYVDSLEIHERLCAALVANLDRFCAANAHMIFWFSPERICETKAMLSRLEGFRFDEHPLIWARGVGVAPNQGIAPDPYRRPRRVYEMAFFGWRGEAKINQIMPNFVVAPAVRVTHEHEKSEEALTYFFSMFVDRHTMMLDPTCGSGSALRAGKKLGATVLGLEIDPENVAAARALL